MSAYLIIEARITEPQRFATYTQVTPDVVARHGGEYVVMGGCQETLEGPPRDTRTVISRWPDRAAALAFWHSPQYAAIKPLREGTGEFRVLLVDGCGTETLVGQNHEEMAS